MSNIFQLVLYQPIFNAFVALYNLIPDVGIVILIITLVIRLILYPLNTKSIKAQKSLMELQPKLEELKKKYKDNQQALAQETMKIYRENKVNPLGSCLPLLIQIPIFIALYQVFNNGLSSQGFELLYSFVPKPEMINPVSLGLINLKSASPILAILAGAAQFWQTKMMSRKNPPAVAGQGGKDENMMTMMNKQMLYMMPLFTVLIGLKLPGGLSLYWLFTTLFTVVQQLIMFKKAPSLPSSSSNVESNVIEGKIEK